MSWPRLTIVRNKGYENETVLHAPDSPDTPDEERETYIPLAQHEQLEEEIAENCVSKVEATKRLNEAVEGVRAQYQTELEKLGEELMERLDDVELALSGRGHVEVVLEALIRKRVEDK